MKLSLVIFLRWTHHADIDTLFNQAITSNIRIYCIYGYDSPYPEPKKLTYLKPFRLKFNFRSRVIFSSMPHKMLLL
jgi:hypothetical protein